MAGIKAAAPDVRLVRRTITRAAGLPGEDFEAVSPGAASAAQAGAFCLHWAAHGLRYGIPAHVVGGPRAWDGLLANFSRSALLKARAAHARSGVLMSPPARNARRRLAGRGRESAEEIAARLGQAGKPLPEGLDVITVSNRRHARGDDETLCAHETRDVIAMSRPNRHRQETPGQTPGPGQEMSPDMNSPIAPDAMTAGSARNPRPCTLPMRVSCCRARCCAAA